MQIPNEVLDTHRDEGWGQELATAMGTPPRIWKQWTFEAGQGLLAAFWIERRGGAHQGGPVRHQYGTSTAIDQS